MCKESKNRGLLSYKIKFNVRLTQNKKAVFLTQIDYRTGHHLRIHHVKYKVDGTR